VMVRHTVKRVQAVATDPAALVHAKGVARTSPLAERRPTWGNAIEATYRHAWPRPGSKPVTHEMRSHRHVTKPFWRSAPTPAAHASRVLSAWVRVI